ncbi:MAG: hypothetical protein V1494_03030 [Candidatus Diapherotrites archaeon]
MPPAVRPRPRAAQSALTEAERNAAVAAATRQAEKDHFEQEAYAERRKQLEAGAAEAKKNFFERLDVQHRVELHNLMHELILSKAAIGSGKKYMEKNKRFRFLRLKKDVKFWGKKGDIPVLSAARNAVNKHLFKGYGKAGLDPITAKDIMPRKMNAGALAKEAENFMELSRRLAALCEGLNREYQNILPERITPENLFNSYLTEGIMPRKGEKPSITPLMSVKSPQAQLERERIGNLVNTASNWSRPLNELVILIRTAEYSGKIREQ